MLKKKKKGKTKTKKLLRGKPNIFFKNVGEGMVLKVRVAQRAKALATKSDELSYSPRTHMVEVEKWLPKLSCHLPWVMTCAPMR